MPSLANLEGLVQPLPPLERQEIAGVLEQLTAGLNAILRDQLLGIYLYGSLITGDFDFAVSDIDLVVALQRPLTDKRFDSLQSCTPRSSPSTPLGMIGWSWLTFPPKRCEHFASSPAGLASSARASAFT